MLRGKWWLFFAEQGFDIEETDYLLFSSGAAVDRKGNAVGVRQQGADIVLTLPGMKVETLFKAGDATSFSSWVDDDLMVLEKDGPWAAELTTQTRAKAG